MEYSSENYKAMLDRLFRRFPSFQKEGVKAYKPGLGNIEFMDQLLGHPHRKYDCIHVAGTNGKGSVSNMIASAFALHGKKVGLFTSPHILDFRERIRIVEKDAVTLIPPEDVWDFVSRWEDTFDHIGMSFFEITTAMAFDWFARMDVDMAVIETGLGGRLDSTNIITPVLSVITNIGLDHCDLLGSTLPEIAYEKAGIIKPCVPVVIGEGGSEINPVFERKVLYVNLPETQFMGDRKAIMSLLSYAGGTVPKYWEMADSITGRMDLQGRYQRNNLRTVLCALEKLGLSDEISLKAIENTAEIAGFHARWERVCSNPEIICDIGHNAHGLKYNFSQLSSLASAGRDVIMVYGSVSDKDVEASLALIPDNIGIIFTNASSHRAMPASEVCSHYLAVHPGNSSGKVTACVKEAVDMALEDASRVDKPLIYIGGSTYVVAEALEVLRKLGMV